MTLRRQAEQLYINGFQDGQDRRQFMTTRTLAFLNTPELKEMQEKAARCDRAFKYSPSNEQERLEMNKKIDEWREQAKKWNDMQTIMEGFEVDEKCFCVVCKNGYITRPATPKEIREVLETVLNSKLVQNYEWRLKSGSVLRLKERSDEHT